jgi:hypothetical protein
MQEKALSASMRRRTKQQQQPPPPHKKGEINYWADESDRD